MQNKPQSSYIVLKNDKKIESMEALLQLKSIFFKQLPLISKTSIIKNMFDGLSQSIIMLNQHKELCSGATFRVFEEVSMANILYFAVNENNQGKRVGNTLMNHLKTEMQKRNINIVTTHSDLSSETFYYKNGFLEIKQKYLKQQIWAPYVHHFSQSKLVVCKILKNINYYGLNHRSKIQYDSCLAMIDGLKYRRFQFSKNQIQGIVNKHLQDYYQCKGRSYIEQQQRKQKIQQIYDEFKKKVLSDNHSNSLLQQICILDSLNKINQIWILKNPYSFVPDGLKQHLTKEKICNRQYNLTSQLFADIYKSLETLKHILPAGSLYLEKLTALKKQIALVLEDIQLGASPLTKTITQNQQL